MSKGPGTPILEVGAFKKKKGFSILEQFQVYRKMSRNYRVPIYSRPPHMHSLPDHWCPTPEGHICPNQLTYFDTSLPPKFPIGFYICGSSFLYRSSSVPVTTMLQKVPNSHWRVSLVENTHLHPLTTVRHPEPT